MVRFHHEAQYAVKVHIDERFLGKKEVMSANLMNGSMSPSISGKVSSFVAMKVRFESSWRLQEEC